MTGQLRSTLENRADQLDTWDVDLDAVLRRGDRRVRRRRTAVAGGLAGVLVVAGGLAAFAGHGHRTTPQPADDNVKPLTYAVGSVIHSGSTTIDVGHRVVSLVPVQGGFLFSGSDRTVYLEMGGTTQAISHLADQNTPIYVSDDGLVAAWWDGQRIQSWPGFRSVGRREVVVVNKINQLDVARSWPRNDPPRIEALASGHVWWWTGRRHMIAEVRPTPTTALWPDSNPPGSGTVVDAAGGQVLVHGAGGMTVTKANLLPWPVGEQDGWKPGGDLVGLTPQVTGVTTGDLAPDGRHWFSEDRDHFTVYDSATGDAHEFDHPGGYPSAMPYQWLGDDTIAAFALYPPIDGWVLQPVNLLVCHVSTGTCVVAAKNAGTEANLVLSDGKPAIP